MAGIYHQELDETSEQTHAPSMRRIDVTHYLNDKGDIGPR
jgi:hypothetical protein